MKEIMCYNKECMFWNDHHCMDRTTSIITINSNNNCLNFVKKTNWKEGIEETISEEAYTKSDLKDIEKNRAKYGTTEKED